MDMPPPHLSQAAHIHTQPLGAGPWDVPLLLPHFSSFSFAVLGFLCRIMIVINMIITAGANRSPNFVFRFNLSLIMLGHYMLGHPRMPEIDKE